jgi:CTP:molybdopterin cytidylyltransferase MocA
LGESGRPQIGAGILAAGRGERFGGHTPKPLVKFRGRPLIAYAIDAARSSGLAPLLVVIGNGADAVADALPDGIECVRNEAWSTGIASSLVALLSVLSGRAGIDAVVIGLADQPLIGADAYRRLADAYDAGARLAVATYGGVRGNPVLLARGYWDEAMALTGDEGARVLLRRHPTVEVACDGTGLPTDVDTPDDLVALERRATGGRSAPSERDQAE